MEPSEFDNIIRNKLQERTSLHHKEVEASKPFVWATIQSNKTTIIPWYYSAAAATLFIICFSWLFIHLQEQNHSEIQLLSQEVERLKSKKVDVGVVRQKNRELDLLCSEFELLEQSLSKVRTQQQPTTISTQLVYQTDTVFITKTEYITEYITSPELKEKNPLVVESEANNNLNTTSTLIYPDLEASSNKTKESASVKVTIQGLSSN